MIYFLILHIFWINITLYTFENAYMQTRGNVVFYEFKVYEFDEFEVYCTMDTWTVIHKWLLHWWKWNMILKKDCKIQVLTGKPHQRLNVLQVRDTWLGRWKHTVALGPTIRDGCLPFTFMGISHFHTYPFIFLCSPAQQDWARWVYQSPLKSEMKA